MNLKKIKKICSFSVSKWHLVTMLAPYLSKEVENKQQICTYFETDMQDIIEEFLSKLTLNPQDKQELEYLNWHSNKECKYIQINELLNSIQEQKIIFIVSGTKNYIEKVNMNINKVVRKNKIKKEITIINCYEVMQFNNNIKQILDTHDKILNTSGEREIGEIFEDYRKSEQDAV